MRAQDSSKNQDQPSSRQSGFLHDYSKLQPDPWNPDLLIYWKHEDGVKTSNKFIHRSRNCLSAARGSAARYDPEQLAQQDR
jgi:hypothetical protein